MPQIWKFCKRKKGILLAAIRVRLGVGKGCTDQSEIKQNICIDIFLK
jgi:hypothetical protein